MGALDGLRVLDVSILVQGPQAGQMLADLGADVVKVEMPGRGDVARGITLEPGDPRSAFFTALNRGKRSIALDLHTAAGREALCRLVKTADVLLSNFRPGTLDGWGLGYEALAAINPRLIYATGSALGPVGPDADREGADLTGQAAGGLISTTGEDEHFPTPVGVVIADHSASQNMATGVLAALYARERTGRGQRVDVSLLGGQVWAQASEITHFLLSGRQPSRANRGHGMIRGVWRVVATADGYLALVGAGPQLWQGFCRAIERPDLSDDPRFCALPMTEPHRQLLYQILDDHFRTRTTKEWCERLRAEGQRFAAVQDYPQLVADPQVWANGYLVEADHPELGRVTAIGNPIRFSDTPADPSVVAPEVGQHTEEILLEAGYTWDEIAELQRRGAW